MADNNKDLMNKIQQCCYEYTANRNNNAIDKLTRKLQHANLMVELATGRPNVDIINPRSIIPYTSGFQSNLNPNVGAFRSPGIQSNLNPNLFWNSTLGIIPTSPSNELVIRQQQLQNQQLKMQNDINKMKILQYHQQLKMQNDMNHNKKQQLNPLNDITNTFVTPNNQTLIQSQTPMTKNTVHESSTEKQNSKSYNLYICVYVIFFITNKNKHKFIQI